MSSLSVSDDGVMFRERDAEKPGYFCMNALQSLWFFCGWTGFTFPKWEDLYLCGEGEVLGHFVGVQMEEEEDEGRAYKLQILTVSLIRFTEIDSGGQKVSDRE